MSCASSEAAASAQLAQATELHAMNGNTSSSVAPSHARNVRPRVDPANDDDMDLSLAPTIVVPPTMPQAADLSLLSLTAPVPYLRTAWDVCSRRGATLRAPSCALKRTLTI